MSPSLTQLREKKLHFSAQTPWLKMTLFRFLRPLIKHLNDYGQSATSKMDKLSQAKWSNKTIFVRLMKPLYCPNRKYLIFINQHLRLPYDSTNKFPDTL